MPSPLWWILPFTPTLFMQVCEPFVGMNQDYGLKEPVETRFQTTQQWLKYWQLKQ